MTSDFELLNLLGVTVLQRLGPGKFCATGSLPNWWHWLASSTDQVFEPVQQFPFLEEYLIEAERFWQRGEPGILNSDIWHTEVGAGRRLSLEVSAAHVKGTAYLLIRNLGSVGMELSELLQAARTSQLKWQQEVTQHLQLEEELMRAKEAAELLSETKSQFLANVSHEIRTPLTAILGMSELLSKTQLSSAQLDYTAAINRSCQNLLRIVNDLLDFSRVESGRLEFETATIQTRSYLEEVRARFADQAESKDLTLNSAIDENVPTEFVSDSVRLAQILDNLIGNAIKFTNAGHVDIRLRMDPDFADNSRLLFTVKDTGPGIAADKQKLIFESFQQADLSTSREYGGTGLGLAIVRQLVECMGGEVRLTSQLGQGSTFYVSLPVDLAIGGTSAGTSAHSEQPIGAGDNNSARKSADLRILVAEDHEINRKLIATLIQHAGSTATCVANGHEAVAAFAADEFDIILMDCQMPKMDGFAATQAIRSREKSTGKHVTIIALTAHALPGFRDKCMTAGMDDYLCKPFTEEELITVITRAHKRNENTAGASTLKAV